MMRMISRAAASAALLVTMGGFCAAQDYAPAPAPSPAPKVAPTALGTPVFSDAQLLNGAGQAANGLQLTLQADKLALPETPGGIGEPLTIPPTTLHLLFRNVSESPMVLDAYNLALSRVTMIVVGPDKKTVAVTRRPSRVMTRGPLPIDFPQVEPGNTFVPLAAVAPLQFPGDFNLLVNYGLYQPGAYKVQVIYSRPATGGPAAWSGTIVSNTLTFHIEGQLPPPAIPPPGQPPESAPQAPPKPPASPAGSSS